MHMDSSHATVISKRKSMSLTLLKISLMFHFITFTQLSIAKCNLLVPKISFLTHDLSVFNGDSKVSVVIDRLIYIDHACFMNDLKLISCLDLGIFFFIDARADYFLSFSDFTLLVVLDLRFSISIYLKNPKT